MGFAVVASLVLAMLVSDMIIGSFYDVLREELASPSGVLLFAAIVAVLYGTGHYVLIGFAGQASRGLRARSASFNAIHVATITVQYAVIAILLFMVAQIAAGSYYDIRLIVAGMAASALPAAALLGRFSYRLLLWYRSNRKHAMVLLLGAAEAASAVAAAGNVVSVANILSEGQAQVGPQQDVRYHELLPGLRVPFFLAIVLPTALSFILRWGGIVLVIRNFSRRIGRAPVSFSMRGLAYYAVARSIGKIDRKSAVIDYMLIAAFGVVMLPYALSSPVIIYVAYPPFGVPAHFFLTTASYLLSLGIYSSAISVSQDMNLRHSIRRRALDEPGLLDSTGRSAWKTR